MNGASCPQHRPDDRALARAGRASDEHVRATDPQPPRGAVVGVPDHQPVQARRVQGLVDRDRGNGCLQGVAHLQVEPDPARAVLADSGVEGAHRLGQVGSLVGQFLARQPDRELQQEPVDARGVAQFHDPGTHHPAGGLVGDPEAAAPHPEPPQRPVADPAPPPLHGRDPDQPVERGPVLEPPHQSAGQNHDQDRDADEPAPPGHLHGHHDGDQEGTGEARSAQQREHQIGEGLNQPPQYLSQFGNHALISPVLVRACGIAVRP